jgi:hypothetical protein
MGTTVTGIVVDRDAILANVRLVTVVEDTNVTDAQIVVLIGQGLQEVSLAYEWPWLQKTASLSLADSTRTIALPADFQYGSTLIDVDHDRRLPYYAPATFWELTGDGGDRESTTPQFFTTWAGNIVLHPIPVDNDTNRLSIHYYRTVTALSAGDDVPEFHTAFHWMLVEYCKWKLYEREEYYDQSERAFITYSRYLADMIDFYSSRFKLEPTAWGEGRFGANGDPNIPSLFEI